MADPQDPHQSPPPPSRESRPRAPIDPTRGMAPPPPPYPAPMPVYAAPSRGGVIGRVLGWGLTGVVFSLLMVSVGFNIYQAVVLNTLTSGPHESTYQGGGPGRVVIVPIKGLIDQSTAELTRLSLQKLRQRPPDALVLRVESPGGIPGPCDRIYQEIRRYRQDTGVPIVASFGSLAASGGYYVAAGCDLIIAEPTCITGSIGVMSQAFTVNLLLEKIGVTPEVRAATGAPEKDVANNMFREWGERDRRVQQAEVDHLHERFIQVVFEGRQAHLTTIEQARAVSDGRIFVTPQAIAAKLVDAEGYLADAIDRAKGLAPGLEVSDRPEITTMDPPARLGLLGMLSSRRSPPVSADQIRRLLVELQSPRLEYR